MSFCVSFRQVYISVHSLTHYRHKMFQLYDTSNDQSLRDAIKEFDEKIGDASKSYDDDDYKFKPSQDDNVKWNVFNIHPYDVSLQNAQTCALCNSPLEGGGLDNNSLKYTALRLPCTLKCLFHLNCIFKYWDEPGRYLHTCPTCRSAPWLNHERLGMVAGNTDPVYDITDRTFVYNVFGGANQNNPSFQTNPPNWGNRALFGSDAPNEFWHQKRREFELKSADFHY